MPLIRSLRDVPAANLGENPFAYALGAAQK
jgi:hypothetical protein